MTLYHYIFTVIVLVVDVHIFEFLYLSRILYYSCVQEDELVIVQTGQLLLISYYMDRRLVLGSYSRVGVLLMKYRHGVNNNN